MEELKLKEEFQFGPHRLQVVAANGKNTTDLERLITSQCKPTCCSIEHAVVITTPVGDLQSLTKVYNDRFATMKAQAKISAILNLKNLKKNIKINPSKKLQ